MSVPAAGVLGVDEFERALGAYLFERAEEARAVRVGDKETSDQAAIVARHGHLFTCDQLEGLRAAEGEATDPERATRLRLVCEGGVLSATLAGQEDALENAVLAARVQWAGEELPLRAAQARLVREERYADRSALGAVVQEASESFNDRRRALLGAREELEADLSGTPDPIARAEAEKGIALQPLLAAVDRVRDKTTAQFLAWRAVWLPRLLGDEIDPRPPSVHLAWLRNLSPLVGIYAKERLVPVGEATLRAMGFDLAAEPGIRADLDDRPQKSPRACVIASDPPRVVHLITRAQGGLHDYEAFLHEAGHALHYAGVDPELPLTYRQLSRDHALTEIYSFLLDAVTREPGWHAEHFGLSDADALAHAEAATFVESLMFRRYSAKLGYELEFWGRFAADGGTSGGYAERLGDATQLDYPRNGFLADMDAGFYSADYLRAWIRAAQVRDHLRRDVGEDWWRSPDTGAFLRPLFRQGTRPLSEEIAVQLGYDPLDPSALIAELNAD